MHKIEFVELFKSIKDLREIISYNYFSIDKSLSFNLSKIKNKIFFITEFQHDINDVFISYNILNSDDVFISTQFYQS